MKIDALINAELRRLVALRDGEFVAELEVRSPTEEGWASVACINLPLNLEQMHRAALMLGSPVTVRVSMEVANG